MNKKRGNRGNNYIKFISKKQKINSFSFVKFLDFFTQTGYEIDKPIFKKNFRCAGNNGRNLKVRNI